MEHGFTADLRSSAVSVRHAPRDRRTHILFGLSVPLILIIVLLSALGRTGADPNESTESIQVPYYDYRVHALNCTSITSTADGTHFRFNTADLPFEFSTVCFGDYREDESFSSKYYGGSGIIVDAFGDDAVMNLKEGSGRAISSIEYHGQAKVVFNGKAESVTFPTVTTTYEGTDKIVQDWRYGTWSPYDGIVIEHPSNVTLADAKFYLMTLEPSGTTNLPEFDPLLMVGAVAALLIIVRAHARAKKD